MAIAPPQLLDQNVLSLEDPLSLSRRMRIICKPENMTTSMMTKEGYAAIDSTELLNSDQESHLVILRAASWTLVHHDRYSHDARLCMNYCPVMMAAPVGRDTWVHD